MIPFTHLFVGWTFAEQFKLDQRDRALVAWAGVIADADGLTLIPDLFTAAVGMAPTYFYGDYHHMLTHGVAAGILWSALALVLGHRKWKAALLSLIGFHIHLLCDVLGSRGPDPLDVWPIPYLAPFSDKWTITWRYQWALNAWPNIVLSIALMCLIFWRAYRRGYSPVSLFSKRADAAFVETLRRRFGYYKPDRAATAQ